MSFQRTVVIIALVTLLIVLAIIAYLIHSAKANAFFPPETPACPDYFEAVAGPDGSATQKCLNTQGLGTNAAGVTNFATATGGGASTSCPITGQTGNAALPCSDTALQARCKWAKNRGISWDGITNRQKSIPNPSGSGTINTLLC